MADSASIDFDTTEVLAGLNRLGANVDARAWVAVGLTSRQMEQYSKQNRPWTDRTGYARASLQGNTESLGDIYRAYIVTGAEYGVWLEVRWGGKFSIVVPTWNQGRQMLMDNLRSLIA